MAKKPQTYWQKRFELYEKRANLKSEAHIKSLAKEYNVAKKAMERDLAVFYNRLAKNNELPDIQAAKKLLEADELKDFHMSLEEYTSLAKANGISGDFTQQLENASLKHRISRLEAMKVQLDAEASILMAKEAKGLEKFTASAYESAYYNGAFEIAKGTGVGKSLFRIDKRKINTVIHKPWAADGRNFSERVWGQHRPQLINNLHRELTSSIMRGTGPDEAIKNIAHQFDVSLSSAARLVQTEEAYFSSVAQKDVFMDLDVEQYEIIATLDSHTSDICQGLDGKVFKMSEFEAGVTAPPFHVRCRTTTAPYFEDEESTRAARNEGTGKTEQVPSNIKYEDWEKGYVKDPKTGKTAAEIEAEAKEKAASVADEMAKAKAGIKSKPEPKPEEPAQLAELAGVKRGKEMTFEEADSGHTNPRYDKYGPYSINCQTCVVAFEARQRGFNVIAKGNTRGSMSESLSHNTALAWIDRNTKQQLEYIVAGDKKVFYKPKTYFEFLEGQVKQGERYTIQFGWRGSGNSGHIVNLDRNSAGEIRLKDNQRGFGERSEWIGQKDVIDYLKQVRFQRTIYGTKYATPPKLLRVDNADFNLDVVNKILEGASK